MRRIGRRFDLGGETQRGRLHLGERALGARLRLAAGARGLHPPRRLVGALLAARRRDAVGAVVLPPERVPLGAGRNARGVPRTRTSRRRGSRYLDADARARAIGARLEPELVIGARRRARRRARAASASWCGTASACPPAARPRTACSRAALPRRCAAGGGRVSELLLVGTSDAFGAGGRRQSAYLLRARHGRAAARLRRRRRGTGSRALGISRDEIDAIAVSHFHADHFGGIPLFLLGADLRGSAAPTARRSRARPASRRACATLARALGHSLDDHRLGFALRFVELRHGRDPRRRAASRARVRDAPLARLAARTGSWSTAAPAPHRVLRRHRLVRRAARRASPAPICSCASARRSTASSTTT